MSYELIDTSSQDKQPYAASSKVDYLDDFVGGFGAPNEVILRIDLGVPFKAEVVKPIGRPEELTVWMSVLKRTFVRGQTPRNLHSATPAGTTRKPADALVLHFDRGKSVVLNSSGKAEFTFQPAKLARSKKTLADVIKQIESAIHTHFYAHYMHA